MRDTSSPSSATANAGWRSRPAKSHPDAIIVEVDWDHGPDESATFVTRPAGEVVAWRILCDCHDATGKLRPERQRWVSEPLIRVPSVALEQLDAGLIYATDTDVTYVNDRDDVSDIVPLPMEERARRPTQRPRADHRCSRRRSRRRTRTDRRGVGGALNRRNLGTDRERRRHHPPDRSHTLGLTTTTSTRPHARS